MNIKKQRIKIYLLFIFICLPNLSTVPSFAFQSREISMETVSSWAVTTTVFKLAGSNEVNNVKLNWMQRKDADLYKIYRDNNLIGEAKGNTYDDYNLMVNKTFTYHVEAFYNGQKVATSISQQATTFIPTGESKVYDNLNGKYITKESSGNKPQGMKINDLYFSYKIENTEKTVDGQQLKGWLVTESYSKTGLNGSWSTPRELAFYPNVKMEGNAFRYNPKTGKVVLSSHYEDENGYTAAKIYLAQITPKGKLEVGTMERPLGHDSRDQSLFIDDDNTAYLLSATNTNSDINIYKLNNRILSFASIYLSCCIYIPDVLHLYIGHAGAIYPAHCIYRSVTEGVLIRRLKCLFSIIPCDLFVILKQRNYLCRNKDKQISI